MQRHDDHTLCEWQARRTNHVPFYLRGWRLRRRMHAGRSSLHGGLGLGLRLRWLVVTRSALRERLY